ncbi:hypothetical protein GQ54DRAFT_306735 [Martensiomyces pterosporus]|nr:hypothetical protein GQ54DRAFT_306735 [Martensiomyces pterosporus]
MSLEQQSKRRRTGSKAADNDSSPGSPNANVSPATTQRAPSVAQSVSVTHSPAVVSQKPQYYQDSTSINPALQYSYEAQQHQQYQAPQQQYAQQDQQQQQQQSSYHQQYTTQQDHQRIADFDTQSNPSSIYSVGSSAAAAAVAAAAAAAVSTPSSALAQPQPRILTSNISMQQPGQQQISIASLSASVSTPASVTTASTATSVTTPHTTMQQPFVSSHALPTSFLGQSPAVASTDYSMLLYQHQHMPSADRSVAVTAGVSGVVSSTSVSPISQHALASADQQYSSIHGQLDGQMRYMAVPGQPSGMPKPLAAGPSAGMPMDRSFRQNPISAQQQQQHGFVAMQYHQAQQHQQHHYSHHYGQHHQQSAFTAQPPATASAAAVAAVMSEGRAGQAQMGSASGSSSMHAGGYHAVHSAGAGSQMAPSQVSAAQVAAAVAAAASAHTIPVVSSGTSSGVVSGGIEQHGLSALKLPIVTQTGGEPSMPDYLDDYTQSYMVGGQSIMEPNSASPTEQTLDADLINRLNELFMKYLEQICSNNITVDSEGESIEKSDSHPARSHTIGAALFRPVCLMKNITYALLLAALQPTRAEEDYLAVSRSPPISRFPRGSGLNGLARIHLFVYFLGDFRAAVEEM